MMKKLLLIVIVFFAATIVFSQNDSLILVNGDVIIGELKDMNHGVATIETAYSDKDFKIEWDGIKEIYTVQSYLVTTSESERFNGKIASSGDKMVKLLLEDSTTTEMLFMDIVYLKSIDEGFWNKIDAFVDIGFDLTKANNQMTFSTRSGINYIAPVWGLSLTYNTNVTTQNEGPNTERTDGALGFKYFLPKDFYIPVSVNYLKSFEQNLQARWTAMAGVGYFFLQTNQMYWGADVGGAYNTENYMPDSIPDRNSVEGYFGTALNLFDIGDLGLSTSAKAFPSFTESGRWRIDFNFDTKYDLPLDFYIKIGFSLNYDNQPVAGATDMDYVLHTGVGWEWP